MFHALIGGPPDGLAALVRGGSTRVHQRELILKIAGHIISQEQKHDMKKSRK